jgi:hypothetical protein
VVLLKRKPLMPVMLIAVVVALVFILGAVFSSPSLGGVVNNFNTSSSRDGDFYAYDQPLSPPSAGAAPQEVAGGDYLDDGINRQVDQSTVGGQERIILKTATLRLVVDAADASLSHITTMASEMGGWVVSSSTSMVRTPDGQDVAQGTITIRVPSDRLDEALNQIKSGDGVGTIEYESVTGQDVTQQYIDLNSRLTNLEAAETQLRQIMEEARRTEDVLNVYNQLVSLRGEIEVVRGQIQYYQESAAFSSITVTLIPKAIEAPIQIAGWSPGRTVESALATLLNVLRFGADVLITLVVLGLPLLAVIAVPVWLIRRTLRRRRLQNTSAA